MDHINPECQTNFKLVLCCIVKLSFMKVDCNHKGQQNINIKKWVDIADCQFDMACSFVLYCVCKSYQATLNVNTQMLPNK